MIKLRPRDDVAEYFRINFLKRMEDDDEEIPQLITLDDHLSEQLDTKLKSSFKEVEKDSGIVDIDSKKVPITILTGTVVYPKLRSDIKDTWALERQLY